MRIRTAVLGTVVALLVAGCGGDDSTGPSNADVAGTWTLAVSNMSGGGISCTSNTPFPLTLSQSGTTFNGTYGAGNVTCVGGGESITFTASGSVVNGSVSGNTVNFDLDTQDFHHTGTLNGNSMSGTATWTFDLGAPVGEVTLSGNWSASKTS